MTVRGWPRTQF